MNCPKLCQLFTLFALLSNCILIDAFAQEVKDKPVFSESEKHFAVGVLPILQQRCLACHGKDPDDIKGEFNVSNIDTILKGGESGSPGMIRGNSKSSLMMEAIRWDGLEMPMR